VLLVFVLAQAFLSVALSGRDVALERLNRQVAELSDMLSLERGRTSELRLSIAELNRELRTATLARDTTAQQLAAAQSARQKAESERDALKAERDRLAARVTDTELLAQAAAARNQQLESQLAATETSLEAEKAAVAARLADIDKLNQQVQALTALRDELEQQTQEAAARVMTEQDRRAALEKQLEGEKNLSDSARAQVALLNRQLEELRSQLASLQQTLDATEAANQAKDLQIADLGQKLNVALARKVEELQRYRSEFFGRLSQVLANRPGIQVVGDRFVFQSEVLFPVGSAELTPSGADQINQLAATLKQIAQEIPSDVNWILRVDGHADRQPVVGLGPYASNWELSAARAITVVKLLIADGIPPDRLAATGFAEYQPLDPADTPEAYDKNRRIDLRLTAR
jgi:chemotaxis protein MotB